MARPVAGPRLDTHFAMRAFVDELVRCGLRSVATSPGSRSTPLLLAFARDPRVRATSHIDERSGSFFALGAAKASGRPVAITCTSGTAAANYLPAVVEAREARVPLLVLTADRPPELREVGAGQTIDQLKLFGGNVKWFADVDEHDATPGRMRWIRQLACRAYWTSLDGRPGPVHVNFAFREPLVPGGPLDPHEPEPGDGPRPGTRPWITRPPTRRYPAPEALEALASEIKRCERPVIVAGREERDLELAATLARFADKMGMPLLADPLSGARRGAAAVAHYDALLKDEAFAAAHGADLVLRFGDLPTSKPLRRWLAQQTDALHVAFDTEGAWQDPDQMGATIIPGDASTSASELSDNLRRRRDREWLERWHHADRAAAVAIARTLAEAGDELTEPRVAVELGVGLPADATLVVGSSMPVRDVETFFPARADPPRVLANRGANGIDGTVSTAFGVAHAASDPRPGAAAGSTGPTVLLCGDITLLHDLGGLLAARRTGERVVLVVLDNDGGGIFHFLPVAGEGDAFVEHVATPHGLDLTPAAELFGLALHRAASPDQFRAALQAAFAAEGSSLVVVRTDRAENRALHARVTEAVRAAVRPAP